VLLLSLCSTPPALTSDACSANHPANWCASSLAYKSQQPFSFSDPSLPCSSPSKPKGQDWHECWLANAWILLVVRHSSHEVTVTSPNGVQSVIHDEGEVPCCYIQMERLVAMLQVSPPQHPASLPVLGGPRQARPHSHCKGHKKPLRKRADTTSPHFDDKLGGLSLAG
jgi:hypothetical protein